MANVYISFLGTNDYKRCTYWSDGREPVRNVRFVQEATLFFNCREWTETDRICIFLTEDARSRNWVDDGQNDWKTKTPKKCRGLKNCIRDLNLKAAVQEIDIPDAKNEADLWNIFQTMYEVLNPGDQVIFDITHAFRSIPMLALVVINYAKVLKEITLNGIYYGAFEALGSLQDVDNMPLEKRLVQVIDLTPMNMLLEWSSAIDGYFKSGNAAMLKSLVHQSLSPIMRDHADLRDTGNALRRMVNNLTAMGEAFSTCRGPKIPETTTALRQNFEQCQQDDLIPAFQPLFEHLRPQVEQFAGDMVADGIQAARWCLKHNLIQQGFTILQETLITHICIKVEVDPMQEKMRNIVTSAATIIRKQYPPSKWKGDAGKNPEIAQKMIQTLKEDGLANLMVNITDERNDLNHAGYNDHDRPPSRFLKNLEKHLKEVEAYFSEQDAKKEISA